MIRRLLKKAFPSLHPLRLWWHHRKADIAALRYGFPARKLVVIGVTGTDGKTTTVAMIAHILNECGIKTGALTTAFFRIGNTIEQNATQKTSPSPFMIQKFLKRCVDGGCTHVVVECSSHGLVQGRLRNLWPQIAVITNISEEHLDYHGSMEEYMNAKSRLIRSLRSDGIAISNLDDARASEVVRLGRHGWMSPYDICYTMRPPRNEEYEHRFGERGGSDQQLWIEEDQHHQEVGSIVVWNPRHPQSFRTKGILELSLIGSFNIENALCAIAAVKSIPNNPPELQHILESLRNFQIVPGRMERIDEGQNFRVYVDFTVTPASYEKTLSSLRSTLPVGKKLIIVTGSCGDRMKEKRPLVGEICARLGDIVLVTNEDPYTEDPLQIIDDVLRGVTPSLAIVEPQDMNPPRR